MSVPEDEWEILMREANELIYAAHVLLQKAHDKMEQAREFREAET